MPDIEEPTAGQPQMKRCVVCKELIQLGAQKCVHCDSYQSWRRHIAVGDSFLALLVALVSVLSLSLPLFKEVFKSHNSNVRVTFQDTQGSYLLLIASNTGSKPGTVGRAELLVSGTGDTSVGPGTGIHIGFRADGSFDPEETWKVITLTAKGWEEERTFIPAGESRPLKLYPLEAASIEIPGPEIAPLDASKKESSLRGLKVWTRPKMTCKLTVEVIQFDGTRETQVYSPDASSRDRHLLEEYVYRNLMIRKQLPEKPE